MEENSNTGITNVKGNTCLVCHMEKVLFSEKAQLKTVFDVFKKFAK
jgi:hypothetical protein